MTYRFGPFRADRIGYRVFEADQALDLTPKLLDLLFYLLERPATLVTKEELLEQVWPGANVTDNALAQAISDLRDALNDSRARRRTSRRWRVADTGSSRRWRRAGPRESSGTGMTSAAGRLTTPESCLAGLSLAVLDFTNVTGDRRGVARRGHCRRRSRAIWPRSITSGSSIAGASDRRDVGRTAACTRWRRPSAPA